MSMSRHVVYARAEFGGVRACVPRHVTRGFLCGRAGHRPTPASVHTSDEID